MIWLSEKYSGKDRPLFMTNKSHYRLIQRWTAIHKIGNTTCEAFNPEIEVILAPKELSYWDDPKENS